jgi:transposase-like protein
MNNLKNKEIKGHIEKSVSVKYKCTLNKITLTVKITNGGDFMSNKTGVCIYCGKSYKYPQHHTHRKYCSRSCGSKASYSRNQHEQSVFENAMELHWSGEESATIARQFGIPVGTVYSWVHDFGGQKQRIEPLKHRLRKSQNAGEWLTALRESTLQSEGYEESPVVLVCEKLHGHSVNKLSTIVFEKLKDNPLNGKTYAFCDKCARTITTLSWNSPIFNISRYIKVSGTFIWAHENFGKSIEISRAEFEHLISLQKHKRIVEKT